MKKTIFSICGLSLAALLIPLQSSAQGDNAFTGHELFDTYCAVCHDTNGTGNGPLASKLEKRPANLTQSTRSTKDMFQIVKGNSAHKINGAMPRWGQLLSDPQIKSIVSYVRFISSGNEPLPGDPHSGKEIYDRHCSACHGIHGRGDGVMVDILKIKPADHTKAGAVAGMSNKELLMTIIEGKGNYMPGWKGILSDDEVAAVASYIRLMSH